MLSYRWNELFESRLRAQILTERRGHASRGPRNIYCTYRDRPWSLARVSEREQWWHPEIRLDQALATIWRLNAGNITTRAVLGVAQHIAAVLVGNDVQEFRVSTIDLRPDLRAVWAPRARECGAFLGRGSYYFLKPFRNGLFCCVSFPTSNQ